MIGDVGVGGDNPIWVQSMTTTNTFDVDQTVEQIHRLEEAGCEVIRVTVPKKEDVEGCKAIRDHIKIPLIADIHYDYRMALACGCCAVVAEIEVLSGRLDGAEAALRRSCEQLEAMQERACLASRAAELADVIYRSGRYEEAERWHAVASEYAASDDVGAQFLVGAIGAKLLARRGSFGAAERAGREAVRLAEQTDALNNRGKVLLDLAEVLWLSGRPDEGDASVALAVEQFERKGNRVAADSARASLEQRHC